MKEFTQDTNHVCRIFDMIKTGDDTFICQVCHKTHNQKSFQELKNATPGRFCHCGGFMKKMELHIPHPISGHSNKPVFYVCHTCGGKYMYYQFACDTEGCRNKCDISEVFCRSCRTHK